MHALLLSLTIAAGTINEGRPCEPEVAARGQADVRSIVEAVYGGDIDEVLRFTHPVVMKMAGREALRRSMEQTLAGMKSAKMSIESLTFPAAPVCLTVERRRFMVVPTLSVLSVAGARMESLNYQFGVLEPNEREWKYLEGSRVNNKTVHILFPYFPRDYRFPPIYRKPI